MTSWIVTISDKYSNHWEIARDRGFWDMTKNEKIHVGDHVYFWLTGGGSWLRRTLATTDAVPITADMQQPWEDSGER